MNKKNRAMHMRIGSDKTGTTFLNGVFARNKTLLTSLNIEAPMRNSVALYSIVAEELGYLGLSKIFSNAKDQERWQKRYEEAASFWNNDSHCSTIILSTETVWGRIIKNKNFSEYAPQLIEVLEAIFEKFEICDPQIYIHLRRASEYCESSYAQLVKGGSDSPFDMYFSKHFNGNVANKSLDFLRLLDNRFGTNSVNVIPFDKKFFSPGDVASDFFRRLSITDNFYRPAFANERITKEVLLYLPQLRREFRGIGKKEILELDKRWRSSSQSLLNNYWLSTSQCKSLMEAEEIFQKYLRDTRPELSKYLDIKVRDSEPDLDLPVNVAEWLHRTMTAVRLGDQN